MYAVLVVDKYGVGMQGSALCKFHELLPVFLTAFLCLQCNKMQNLNVLY